MDNLHEYRKRVRTVECPYCLATPYAHCVRMPDPPGVNFIPDYVEYVHDERCFEYELTH